MLVEFIVRRRNKLNKQLFSLRTLHRLVEMVQKSCSRSCITDCAFKSEYGHEYTKVAYRNYKDHIEVPIPCSYPIFAQELGERGNQLLPQHSKINSIYRRDYHRPDEGTKPRTWLSNALHSKSEHRQRVDVDVKNCGYEKYLDIYATTKALDHRAFSPRELKHDAITVWDWIKIPKVRSKSVPINVPITKRDLDTSLKLNKPKSNQFVPNKGLLSEYQEKFVYTSLAKPKFV